ncbi:MAG: hypothetical protein Q9197_005182, partial [Variospora fuerteventurae]
YISSKHFRYELIIPYSNHHIPWFQYLGIDTINECSGLIEDYRHVKRLQRQLESSSIVSKDARNDREAHAVWANETGKVVKTLNETLQELEKLELEIQQVWSTFLGEEAKLRTPAVVRMSQLTGKPLEFPSGDNGCVWHIECSSGVILRQEGLRILNAS